jgi:hypothetical protein
MRKQSLMSRVKATESQYCFDPDGIDRQILHAFGYPSDRRDVRIMNRLTAIKAYKALMRRRRGGSVGRS